MSQGLPEWALTTTVQLSQGFRVEITAGPSGMICEWSPETPAARGVKLSKKDFRRYRAARDELLARVAARMGGGDVLVVEV